MIFGDKVTSAIEKAVLGNQLDKARDIIGIGTPATMLARENIMARLIRFDVLFSNISRILLKIQLYSDDSLENAWKLL